jgi:CHAT domain-containing protein
MPAQAQILQYAVLEDKLLIWVITRENFSVQAVKIESSDLSEKIRAYVQHVKSVSDESEAQATEQSAKALYDLLVKPVDASLDRGKLLCIVPDKSLHYLPFAALVSSLTGKYLMEDFRLETSPSASVFIACSEQARLKARPVSEKLLSVGNPDFDRKRFQTLIPLKAAEQEAQTITGYYMASRLLLGRNAQEKLVRAESEKADVIHFALHYVVDDPSSMLSGLVLAGTSQGKEANSSDDGMWLASEIYQTRLSRPRLVVLSACQTGVEYQYRGEGAVSIARTFIAAGVPVVVASLWPVDSESTSKLMMSFHLHRTRDHLSTSEALRQAQLELLNSDDKRYGLPYYWAAFTVIGGYSEF